METVEVIIRIPKRTYDRVSERGIIAYGDDAYYIGHAIANGTVLPKGHGDLKDVSNLLTVTDYDGENEKTYVLYDEIKHAPIIIEADDGGKK